MRTLIVIAAVVTCSSALASEIREFDVKTLQRLGNELTRVSQTPDRGATTPERKRARETAIAALKEKLFNVHYDYVVLGDPAGSGFLVYALASTGKPNEFVLAGHFRVTVSADGAKAERVDALSRSLAIQRGGEGLPAGSHLVGMHMVQIVSSKPVETLVYTSNLAKMPIYVATLPHGKIYEVANGRITDTGKSAGKQ
jgi:hypothetical protein